MNKHLKLGDSTTRQYITKRYRYMITIRKHQVKDKVLLDEIHSVLHHIQLLYPNIRFMQTVYEIDPKYEQLHCHSIVHVNTKIRFASISKFKGFRIFWRPIFDIKGARSYLTKVIKTNKQQKILLNRNLLL